jgi:zinc D-Ala-D-Ala carboxypeptidase
MNYFAEKEFACRCCGVSKVDDSFLEMLNDARRIADIPFSISSGYRCPKHDAAVGGKGNHDTGKASDVKCDNSSDRIKMISAFLKAGFTRIGIAKTFIHVDTCEDKPQHVCWVY